jgi:hypothetical protein
VPKFEAHNIFYLIWFCTKNFHSFVTLFSTYNFNQFFFLLTHLKKSSINYYYHLFTHYFHILMIFLHLFMLWILQIRWGTSFLKHKTIKTSSFYFLILSYKFILQNYPISFLITTHIHYFYTIPLQFHHAYYFS